MSQVYRMKRGLDLPINGQPAQDGSPDTARAPKEVALLGSDYLGLRMRPLVEVGDTVKRGQPIFGDRKKPDVLFTSPAAGTVKGINRGARRVLVSFVIETSEGERSGNLGDDERHSFASWNDGLKSSLDGAGVRALLLESGLWPTLRTRPYSKVPLADETPSAIFVTAIDTLPLAAKPETALAALWDGAADDFELGVKALSSLGAGKTYVCRAPGSSLGGGSGADVAEFEGPHPAGAPGTHIHTLQPVGRGRDAWYIGYQDVAAIGHLLRTGQLQVDRIISLAGPAITKPRLVRTRVGAELAAITEGELAPGSIRVISGSVLNGRKPGDGDAYLGRYHLQVNGIIEDDERVFIGWLRPGLEKYSVTRAFLSAWLKPKAKFDFTSTTHGEHRAMVPIGVYEKVMPLDIMPTFLLRALAVHDLERAEQLGALELDEEDLALCTFVCPGKTDWGRLLRETLDLIESGA